jgi:hypothetical protein
LFFFLSNVLTSDPVVLMNDEFFRSITNHVYSPSPDPSSPLEGNGGGGGGGGNAAGIIPTNTNDSAALEVRRLRLVGKLEQLTASFGGPNSLKHMNSSSLVNLAFTGDDRVYMQAHLVKFHPNFSENQFGMVRNKGFSCKTKVSKEIFNMFQDVNS